MPVLTPEALERKQGPLYKWIALSNTTLGVLMVTINASILLIALPDIFKGIALDPLKPENTSFLLWLIMGFLVVTAVLGWLGRGHDSPRKVRLEVEGDVLELSGASSEEQDRLVEMFLSRHAAEA